MPAGLALPDSENTDWLYQVTECPLAFYTINTIIRNELHHRQHYTTSLTTEQTRYINTWNILLIFINIVNIYIVEYRLMSNLYTSPGWPEAEASLNRLGQIFCWEERPDRLSWVAGVPFVFPPPQPGDRLVLHLQLLPEDHHGPVQSCHRVLPDEFHLVPAM